MLERIQQIASERKDLVGVAIDELVAAVEPALDLGDRQRIGLEDDVDLEGLPDIAEVGRADDVGLAQVDILVRQPFPRVGLEGGNLNSVMRAPKLRGFKNPFRVEYQVVNLDKLAELYPKGGDVTIGDLVAKGAVRKNEKVKVLGTGDISVALTVSVDKVSGSAEQKIVAAGGSIK